MSNTIKVSDVPENNSIIDENDFAKAIKYKRTLLGFTRQEAANYCNINYRTLQNIENGNKNTSISNVFKVAKMLGIELISNIVKKD